MGSSFKVPVQTPSFQGAFTALTEHVRSVAFNVCGLATLRPAGTSSGQAGRAEYSGGGLGVHGWLAASLSPRSGPQSSSSARAPSWWAVGYGRWPAHCLNAAWPCGAAGRPLCGAGPHGPASRDPGGSLALKSL